MFSNEIHQAIDRFSLQNVKLNRRFAHVEIDFTGRAADVPKIGVCHLAGPVDDAAHNSDLYALEMLGSCFDTGRDSLQIEERAATGRASNVVGFEGAAACCLENIVSQPQ